MAGDCLTQTEEGEAAGTRETASCVEDAAVGGMARSPVPTGYLREALGGGRHRQSCFFPVRLILWVRRISDEPIMTCRI